MEFMWKEKHGAEKKERLDRAANGPAECRKEAGRWIEVMFASLKAVPPARVHSWNALLMRV